MPHAHTATTIVSNGLFVWNQLVSSYSRGVLLYFLLLWLAALPVSLRGTYKIAHLTDNPHTVFQLIQYYFTACLAEIYKYFNI